MRTLPQRWIALLSVTTLLLGAVTVTALEPPATLWKAHLRQTCQGKFKGRQPTPAELQQLFSDHKAWLRTHVFQQITPEALSDPRRANLCEAILKRADFSKANLNSANLSGANLSGANLSGAILVRADLSSAWLFGSDLSKAQLDDANLTDANLSGANLSGATIEGANLAGAWFEPSTLPDVHQMAWARNLAQMRYVISPEALVKLRKAFREAGFYEQERKITYAIKHSQTYLALEILGPDPSWGSFLEAIFSYVFFELPTLWGLEPGRALRILLFLIPVFAIPYIVALRWRAGGGIWRKWSDDRIEADAGTKEPERLRLGWRKAVAWGLYFSVLSAFNIGWRELNVGNWIQRLQGNEYTLRATRWVRTVSGIQSLVSVYLLAMWALTYFGRPFE